jgi:hypothetical protein
MRDYNGECTQENRRGFCVLMKLSTKALGLPGCFLYTIRWRRNAIVAKPMDARTKGLTNVRPVAYPRCDILRAAMQCSLVALAAISPCVREMPAQDTDRTQLPPADRGTSATATIFWTDVPLIDALSRLEKVFGDAIFLDRRVDPNLRVSLNMRATSLEEVVTSIDTLKLGVSRIGGNVYVGPSESAKQLIALSRLRTVEANRLPASLRKALLGKRNLTWPRLAEPRGLVTSVLKQVGWRVEGADRIPHDLWRAGELLDLSVVEQLALLLVGFDLTFEIQSESKAIAIVPLDPSLKIASEDGSGDEPATSSPKARKPAATKQVYSLRVVEKPVGPVLQELSRRLNWQLKIDEAAITAAGRSLDARVSMAVENVDQDELLEALLEPAGLVYEREGNQIRIGPGEPVAD